MIAAITILHFAFLWYFLLGPALHEHHKRAERAAQEHFRNFQAFAILKYHPAAGKELRNLSVEELRRNYNVTAMYNELGL